MWLLLLNKLPTSSSLFIRNITNQKSCFTCPHIEETTIHIFAICPNAWYIWNKYDIDINSHELYNNVHQLCNSITSSCIYNNLKVPTITLTPIILWNIWKTRNNKLLKTQNTNDISNYIHTISFHALEFNHLSYTTSTNPPRYMVPGMG